MYDNSPQATTKTVELGCLMTYQKSSLLFFLMRSKAQVRGVHQKENKHNALVSALAKARQFNKLTAAKSSRMFQWMAAQTSFVSKVAIEYPDSNEDGNVHVCNVFRPMCSEHPQVVLCKVDLGGILKFKLCLVFAIYRGSVVNVKDTAAPRHLKVSKSLGFHAPAESVARLLVVELEHLEGGSYVVSALSPARLVTPCQDVIFEMTIGKSGEKNGKLFLGFSDKAMELIRDIDDGKVNPLAVFLPKQKQVNAAIEDKSSAQSASNFEGFTSLDFPKGPQGQKHLKSFFVKLVDVYKKNNIELLRDEGYYKIGKKLHRWTAFVVRMALYFETVAVTGDKSNDKKLHSQCVFHKLCELLTPKTSNTFNVFWLFFLCV